MLKRITESQNMFKRRRSHYLYICFVGLVICVFLKILAHFILPIEIEITHRDMLEQHKCPACFGENLCNDVYLGKLKLTEWTRYKVSKLMNARNVYHAVLPGNKKVIVKKLGHDEESEMLDSVICKLSGKPPDYCNPAHYIKFLTTLYTKEKNAVIRHDRKNKYAARKPLPTKTLDIRIVDQIRSHTQVGNDFLGCVSTQELLDYIIKRSTFHQLAQGHSISLENILSILIINPEPLVLMTFPAEEGWPVPKYYGSCGRLAVVENAGYPLSSALEEPFTKRARLALQVLKLAQKFTKEDPNVSLYLTDWSMDNFVVDTAGVLRAIDLEHVVLVNRSHIREIAAPGWDVQHSSSVMVDENDLDAEIHFSYSLQDLCTHEFSDLNLFGACQWILSSPSSKPGKGLLFDVSDVQDKHPLLPKLLKECSRPSKLVPGAREEAAEMLIDILVQI